MNAEALLEASLSANAQERERATNQLGQALDSNAGQYLLALSNTLVNPQSPSHIRNAAGLAIKNTLSARESSRQEEFAARWTSLDQSIRDKVKSDALEALDAQDKLARNVAGQVVAALGAIELPLGLWNNLIQQLLVLASRTDKPALRQATLQAIGFVCESVRPEVLQNQSNEILTAVVQGARKEETDVQVQLAAIHALYNSLEFVRENFSREGERNYIMQVVCEATQSAASDVQVAAFECLVKIMQLYYDYMKLYMEKALFGLTILGMKHADENVALQAVEFWSTVCDEEIELALEAEEAAEFGEAPERQSSHFARVALPEILPVLLHLLTKQDEDATEDEWNVSMAAGTCLGLLAQCVGDAIVSPIIPFVESNIRSPDWHLREAAIMAFGSILDGPEEKILAPLVQQALPILMNMMTDQSWNVRDTTAWTLGRISDVLVKTIDIQGHLPSFINAIVVGLDGSPRIVSNCCWSIMNLSEQLVSPAANETGPMTPYFEGLVEALARLTNKHSNEANSRTSAYEALSTLVANAPDDCKPTVSKLALTVLERGESLLSLHGQLVGADDRNNYNEMQINLCSLLTSIIRRFGREIQPLADRIMTFLLQLIQTSGKQSPVLEDAFLCVGALTSALETGFSAYITALLPFLHSALRAHEEYQLCGVAVGLVGDICRALGESSSQYCQSFMEALLGALQSPVLHRSVKPQILSAFGDVALALGPLFEPYLQTTVEVLNQAGSVQADPENYDLVDYINGLREAILETYVGIVGGLKAGGKANVLLPYINTIFSFLHLSLVDQERTDAILRLGVGLIGDLAEAFPNGQLKEALAATWISEALKAGRTRSGSHDTKKLAKWAKEMVRRATS